MPIIALADLQAIMPDTNLSVNTATSSLAQACIDDAIAKVKEKLARRYDVSASYFNTSTAAAPALVMCSRWLAAGYTYAILSRGGKDALTRSDKLEKKAMDNLKELMERKADLVDQSGDVIAERSDSFQVLSNTQDYSETFNEDDPLHWSPDQDKLDDIEDERDT